uniref:Uncharacterized protein n=1 Tax=Candidozyma auris TaxID=498019 RepID=A0A0L0P1T5_CANAR
MKRTFAFAKLDLHFGTVVTASDASSYERLKCAFDCKKISVINDFDFLMLLLF